MTENRLIGLRGAEMLAEAMDSNHKIYRVCLGDISADFANLHPTVPFSDTAVPDPKMSEYLPSLRAIAEHVDALTRGDGLIPHCELADAIASNPAFHAELGIDSESTRNR
eukprot:CAMPEP_0172191266 /NCGR_PEP_ID=MMETSP1050-20130122/23602_1 /TAXON_ID=233186 /ORGANISM="Cryptomonas curvata, Strain CCAP979/52" /LENGTH=109 /DNA_ID=CAMNT_0012866289 /DNA_START=416 /DNA_END=742 /DNA_ORIENTATION=+